MRQHLSLQDKFEDAVVNDMNTSMGITIVYDMLKSDINDKTKRKLIESYDYVLSLDLLKAAGENADASSDIDPELEKYVLSMIEERKAAKKEKNFARADEIRDELLSRGIAIKDTREGVKWEMV